VPPSFLKLPFTILRLVFLLALLLPGFTASAAETATGFKDALRGLNAESFAEKQQAISTLSQFSDPRVGPVLRAMMNGELYVRDADGVMVVLESTEDTDNAREIVSGKTLNNIDTYDYNKIRVNNRLRVHLRTVLAEIDLNNKSADVRLAAVEQLMKDLDDEAVLKLRTHLTSEADKKVIEAIQVSLALIDLKSEDQTKIFSAIKTLDGNLYPEVRVALQALQADYQTGDIAKALTASLNNINGKLEMLATTETIFFGLSLGSVLLLSAIGLAITFGVMGVINMAHGELMMLGAYTTYIVQQLMPGAVDYSIYVAIPAAFVVSGLFGIAIERGVIRHLYGRPLETLLATFGISLILQQLVRTTVSAQNVTVSNPSWMSGSMEIMTGLSLTYNRLFILLFSLLVFALLLFILKKTSLGLQVRAVTQNRQMARAMGIRSDWVDAMTFGLGSGIAGVAGVALSQLTNVGPNMGQSYIIDSFMVVVFGGVGNLWGTLVGAFSLGVANKILEPWAGAVLSKILVLVFIILFIQKRPRGLFPQKGRAAEN